MRLLSAIRDCSFLYEMEGDRGWVGGGGGIKKDDFKRWERWGGLLPKNMVCKGGSLKNYLPSSLVLTTSVCNNANILLK